MTSYILMEDITDHLPVLLLLKNVKPKATYTNTYIRDTKHFNKETFSEDLYEQLKCIESSMNYSTIDKQFGNFVDIFS